MSVKILLPNKPTIVTTAERLALSPYESEVVYDTTTKKYYYWDGTQWVEY